MTPEMLRALALGALQGATEFLPVSSSGHLIIVPELLGWPASSLTFDVVVHWATAIAVLLFFWRDWAALAAGAWRGARSNPRRMTPELRLLLLIAAASIPAVIVGMALVDTVDEMLTEQPRTMARFAAAMLLVTAAILTASEVIARRRSGRRTDSTDDVSASTAGIVGVGQALAIAPGISRSGTTIACGMGRGLTRATAARFSFLLAAPIMVGAGVAQLAGFATSTPSKDEVIVLAAGFAAAFIVGIASIAWLMHFLRRSSLYVFAAYTAVAGLLSLWLLRGPG
jgi:undecaprenyl-diphosphatase